MKPHKAETVTGIPTWTTGSERKLLADMAAAVRPGGVILEIGCLYGGMTAILAKANPRARVIAIDNFSWKPKNFPHPSKRLMEMRLKRMGIKNVKIIEGDSRVIGTGPVEAIELLLVDGGHSYEYVFPDLTNFAPHAQVVALHDYKNEAWPSVEKAVEDFLFVHDEWKFLKSVDTVAVLQRKAAKWKKHAD